MKKLLFMLLPVILLFGACKKNNDVVNPPAPGGGGVAVAAKIKTISSGNMNTFTYDGQGRQLKSAYPNGSGYEYEYLPGIVNIKILGAAGVYQSTDKYEMSAEGLCTRVTSSINPNTEYLYLYNADKTLAKQITISNGVSTVFDYFYSNGNCDSLRQIGNNGNWQSTVVYTYYTGKTNVLSLANTGEDFFGKVDKNIRKSEQYKFSDGSSGALVEYAYDYDAQGRVTKKTTTAGNNLSITLYSYY